MSPGKVAPERAGEALRWQQDEEDEQNETGSPSCIGRDLLLIGNQQLHIKSLPLPAHFVNGNTVTAVGRAVRASPMAEACWLGTENRCCCYSAGPGAHFLSLFGDRVSLYGPSCPGAHCAA